MFKSIYYLIFSLCALVIALVASWICAKKDGVYTYFQVTASMVDESTFQREIRPLQEIRDNYEKIILTLDRFTLGNYEGIKVIHEIDWLLEDNN